MTPIFEPTTTIEVVPVSEDAAAALIDEEESKTEGQQKAMTAQDRRADHVTGPSSLHLDYDEAQKTAEVDDNAPSESSFESGDTELDDVSNNA